MAPAEILRRFKRAILNTNGIRIPHARACHLERAEFQASGKRYIDTIFDDGESPLKHAHDIELKSSSFKWKYPLWYCLEFGAFAGQ